MKINQLVQCDCHDQDSLTDYFNEANLISTYSRAQAFADGILVDVSETALEAGFTVPAAVTRAVWGKYIEWTNEDTNKQTNQDETGRLWDVLSMLHFAIKLSPKTSDRLIYRLDVIPRDGKSRRPKTIKLKAVIGGGDKREPVFTVMLPDED